MKLKHLAIVVLTVISVLLSACGPNKEELAATSAAETIAAASPTPTITPTYTPTVTPTPTNTPTPTTIPSPTPTPTLTPTPLPEIGATRESPLDGMVLMYVPAGDFVMGSRSGNSGEDESPGHLVHLDAFWMDQTEVTNAMFALFVEATGYETAAERVGAGLVFVNYVWTWVEGANWLHPIGSTSNIEGLDNHPVVQVNWNEAVAYCTWAGGRLPTEAEWEYAAGGTDGRIYPWGNQDPTGTLVNFADVSSELNWSDSSNDGYKYTAPVGSYPAGASPFGILDMAGNVTDFIADWYDPQYYSSSPRENPTGPTWGDDRVMRGGSFLDGSFYLRTSVRIHMSQTDQTYDVGFRCVQSP
jgi:formylglycine-generating enzyme required for sulfatase activity